MDLVSQIVIASTAGVMAGLVMSGITARRMPEQEKSGPMYTVTNYRIPTLRDYTLATVLITLGVGICAAFAANWLSLKSMQQDPPAADTSVVMGALGDYVTTVGCVSLAAGVSAGLTYLASMHNYIRLRAEKR